MKTSIAITALLAAAGTAIAAPSHSKRALQNLEIFDLTAALYSQELPTNYVVSFALNDPNTNIDTDCSASWAEGMAGFTKFNCTDNSYQVSFPNGIGNIEDFTMRVSRPDGSEAGQNQVSGVDWGCKKTPNQYPEETCAWVGVFNIELSKA